MSTDYELTALLNQGGMARLYMGRRAGKLVAIKQLLPQLAGEPAYVTMFLDEARLMAGMAHRNIVHVHELLEDAAGHSVIMELVRGASVRALLAAAVEQRRQIPYAVSAAIIADACAAAHYAHELSDNAGRPLGVVHRDINPANIMVSEDGVVKLVDFGVALATSNQHKTRTASIKGTVAYMAPEQVEQRAVDRRTDVFSLGVTLFELCAQKRPFHGDSELQLMMAVVNEPLPDPRAFVSDIPDALCDVLRRATAKSPEHRYQSAAELGAVLRAFADTQAEDNEASIARWLRELVPNYADAYTATQIEQPTAPQRSRARMTIAALAFAIAVATTAVLYRRAPAARPQATGVTVTSPTSSTSPTTPATPQAPATSPAPTVDTAAVIPSPTKAPAPVPGRTERLRPRREPLTPRPTTTPPAPSTSHPPEQSTPVIEPPRQLGTGTLAIYVKPFGEVFIDGKRMGLTPLDGPVSLTEGAHTVRVFCERNGKERVESVTVLPNRTVRLNIDLR